MTIADSIWIATALLHRENSGAADFSVHEITEKASGERLVGGFKPGLQVFASKHCVANKPPNSCRYRVLFETTRGRRRLFRNGDPFHPNRQDGKIRPERAELPPEYQPLVDWYDRVYSRSPFPTIASVSKSPVAATARHEFPSENESRNSAFAGLDALQAEPVFVGAEGTVVLPERLRRALHIGEGSCLSIYREEDRLVLQPITEDFIRSLRGCCKGPYSLVEDREREHRIEKRR